MKTKLYAILSAALLFVAIAIANAEGKPDSTQSTDQSKEQSIDQSTEQSTVQSADQSTVQDNTSEHQRAQKRVTAYSAYGYQKGERWVIPIRFWVSEALGTTRRISLKAAQKIVQLKADIDNLTQQQQTFFHTRAESFLRDSQSDEVISIQFDNDPQQIRYQIQDAQGNNETDRNGNLQGLLELSKEIANGLFQAQNSTNGWLTFKVVSKDHFGAGRFRLIEPLGLSVISDIDDTIKITEIPQGNKVVMQNTFFKEFKAVPEMLEMYRQYPDDTAFHYVSGGPWQLYQALSEFLFEGLQAFPKGSVQMKNVRTNLTESESFQDIAKLIAGGATIEQKLQQIEQLLADFPQRKFILIGDSGEHDPEIFAKIKQKHPKQIVQIHIRDLVSASECNAQRLAGMIIIPVESSTLIGCSKKITR